MAERAAAAAQEAAQQREAAEAELQKTRTALEDERRQLGDLQARHCMPFRVSRAVACLRRSCGVTTECVLSRLRSQGLYQRPGRSSLRYSLSMMALAEIWSPPHRQIRIHADDVSRVPAQAQYEQVKSEAAASSVQVEKLTSQLAAVKHEARDLHQQVAGLTQQARTQPRTERLSDPYQNHSMRMSGSVCSAVQASCLPHGQYLT